MLQDFYSKLSDQEKKILYVTLGFIVFAVFDFLFLQPVSFKLKNLDKDIAQTKSDIRRDVRFLAYQEKIFDEDKAYRVYQTDEQKTEEEIIAAFLKTVETLGTEAEINLGKLNPAEAVPKKGYIEYYANVECNGKLENIIKFIHKIDTTNNLLRVVKMNIVGKKASADEVVVSLKISKLIIDTKSASGELNPAEVKSVKNSLLNPASLSGGQSSDGNTGLSTINASDFKNQRGQGSVGASGDNGHSNQGSLSGKKDFSGGVSGGVGGGDGKDSGGKGVGEGGSGSGGGKDGANAIGGQQGWAGNEIGASSAGGGNASGNGGGGGIVGKAGGGAGGDGVGVSLGGGGAGSGSDGTGGGVGSKGGSETDDKDAQAGEGGGDSTTTGTLAGKGSKTAKNNKSAEKVQTKKESKKPSPLDKADLGGRMEVQSLESLWNNFWGIKPKPQEEKPAVKAEKKKFNRDEYKTEDGVKPSPWERLLEKNKL